MSEGNGRRRNSPLDPMVLGMFQRIPDADQPWPEAERREWLTMLEAIFKLVYKSGPTSAPDKPSAQPVRSTGT